MIQILAVVGAAVAALTPLQRARDLRDALGVNVHIEYTDGQYRDLGRVLSDLQYLGVRNVRDTAPDPANQGQAGYAALAKGGVRFDLFVNGGPIAPALRRLEALERTAPGAIVGVEGPNEVNNHASFQFEGEHDRHKAATRYQAALYAQVKADPGLSALPVLAFTDYPYTYGRADVQNEHPYPPGDRAPGSGLRSVVQAAAVRAPGAPVVFTEIGYSTSGAASDVSQLAQARLLLGGLLEAASLGVSRIYLYELLDAYPDPNGEDHEKHFGLFELGGAPKTAAKMLRRLSEILKDEAPEARSFKLRAPIAALSGGGPDLRTLMFQKANGEQILALWREAPIFTTKPRMDVELAPETVDLRLRAPHGGVTITDPVAQTQGRSGAGSSVLRIKFGSNPLLIQIEPAGSSST